MAAGVPSPGPHPGSPCAGSDQLLDFSLTVPPPPLCSEGKSVLTS